MREAKLCTHTVKSHGVSVAKKHKYDWIILLFLIVTDIILNVIRPFYRFVGEDMINDFKYPLKSNTVPFWAVPVSFSLLYNDIVCILYKVQLMT